MDKIELLREQIRSEGWTFLEIAIHDDHPYNGTIIGWKIDGYRCKEKLAVAHNTLQEALELFNAKAPHGNA